MNSFNVTSKKQVEYIKRIDKMAKETDNPFLTASDQMVVISYFWMESMIKKYGDIPTINWLEKELELIYKKPLCPL